MKNAVKPHDRTCLTPILERKKMGLAASQARLLTITARKADCEFQSMKLSHEKIALSRDMERISDEYQAAMNKTKLVYDYYGNGASEMALNYGLLMTPSIYNDYYPKLLTDNKNRVVLSGPYAAAAAAAGIPKEGYSGTPSSAIRNAFVEALKDGYVISASTAANIESVSYNNAIGLGATFSATTATQEVSYDELMNLIKANSVDTYDYGIQLSGERSKDSEFEINKSTYPQNALVSGKNAMFFVKDKNGNYTETSDNKNANVTLYDLLTSENEYIYMESSFKGASTPFTQIAYMQQLLVGTEDSNSFLNWMVDQFSAVLGGVTENDLALQYAYNQVYDLIYPNENLQYMATDALNNHSNYFLGDRHAREGAGGYEQKKMSPAYILDELMNECATKVCHAQGTGNPTYANVKGNADDYIGIVYSSCGDGGNKNQWHYASVDLNNIAKVFLTAFMEYKEGIENSKYSYELGQTKSGTGAKGKYNLYTKNNSDTFTILAGTDVTDGTENLISGFYDALFNRICINGWTENDNISDAEYMQELLKNGSVFISSIDNDGNYYQNSYSTDTYIAEVTDNEGIAKAQAKYNSEKAKIENKENTIDMKMKNLDTEISSLTTEYDTMKGVINKTIEKSFKRYDA